MTLRSDGVVVVAVLAGIVVPIAVLLLLRRLRGSPEVRALRADVRSARSWRRSARRARERALASARAAVRRERRRHASTVRGLTARVRGLEDPRGRVVARLGPVVLHECAIVVSGTTLALDGLTVEVGISGGRHTTRRPTFTRAALGAAAFGTLGALGSFALKKRETTDTRQAHLLIHARDGTRMVDLDHRSEGAAHRFAEAVRRTVVAAPALAGHRRAELSTARAELAAATAETSALGDAQRELDRVRTDPVLLEAVAASERALEEARTALRAQRARTADGSSHRG
ncbi:MAG: hypothetical protein RLZZ272_1568 [Actinomycetota bacterium]|jgi:hypothetical protein